MKQHRRNSFVLICLSTQVFQSTYTISSLGFLGFFFLSYFGAFSTVRGVLFFFFFFFFY